MSTTRPVKSVRKDILAGAALAAAGIYLILVGLAVLPPPGGPDNQHAPWAVVLCIGLLVLCGGIGGLIQGLGRGDRQGVLAADAPSWLHLVQDLLGVLMFGLFAVVGSWIAVAGEAGQFSGRGIAIGGDGSVTFGRVVFGLGAVICWAITIAALVRLVRARRRRNRI